MREAGKLSPPPCTPYGLPSPHTPGIPFLFLEASDGDEPGTANSDLRFYILNQAPAQPSPHMFQLEPQLGALALSPEGEPELGVMRGEGQGKLRKAACELPWKGGRSWREEEERAF